jgi:hypothetical protein
MAWLVTGCAVVPIPTRRHVPLGFEVRGPVPVKAIDSLAAGSATRARVLLALGEPDHAWNDDRFFLYRWTTVGGYWMWMITGGYQGAGGSLPYGERQHDLLFAFDDSGVLRWRGELRQWDVGDRTAERPSLPMELALGHLHASAAEPARLTLDRAEIQFDEGRQPSHAQRLDPGRIEAIRLRHFGQLPRNVDEVGCELVFRKGGHREKLRVVLPPEELLVLLDYVRHANPGVRVEG